MNNWLKIGLPILIAVLLVVATVGVTLAITQPFTPKSGVTAAYNTAGNGGQFQGQNALCPNCTGYQSGKEVATAPRNGTGTYCGSRGGCWQGGCFNDND